MLSSYEISGIKSRLPDKMFHPVLFDTVARKHYVLFGSFMNNIDSNNYLCMFPKNEDHYITSKGIWLNDQRQVYLPNKFIKMSDTIVTMNRSQKECYECHLHSGLIENVIYIDVDSNGNVCTKLKKTNNQLQINMSI